MKGISAVVVVILILMMSVGLASIAYFFLTGVVTETTETGEKAIEKTVESMRTIFSIESITQNKIIVRNIGGTNLTNFSIYINNKLADFSAPGPIKPGQIGTINVTDFINNKDKIKVSVAGGITSLKTSPDPCDNFNIVLCLKFDEGSGSYAVDSSSYENDGSLVGMEVGDWKSGSDCVSGSCLEFDGGIEYVSVTDSPDFNLNEMSIEMWIYVISQDQDWEEFIRKGSDRLETRLIADQGIWWNGISTAGLWNFNEWNHIIYVSNGGTTRFYVNGVEVSNSPWSGSNLPLDVGEIRIGSGYAATFNGRIDEVRIYNKAIY